MEKPASHVEDRTFSLPAEQTSFIDSLVTSGTYSSASEVVRAGLQALQESDAAVERWLRDDVVPTYDAMKADPCRGISLTDASERLRRKHLQRLEDEAQGAAGSF